LPTLPEDGAVMFNDFTPQELSRLMDLLFDCEDLYAAIQLTGHGKFTQPMHETMADVRDLLFWDLPTFKYVEEAKENVYE
jgi:hypothetical protein